MTLTRTVIYIPRDTTACSLGADRVAGIMQQAIDKDDLPLHIVRNGSRGLYWLEPMLEVETEQGRVAFGPVTPDKVAEFIAAKAWQKNTKAQQSHPLYLGLTEEIPYLKNQQRLNFARVGIVDPGSLEDFRQHGGFAGLKNALER